MAEKSENDVTGVHDEPNKGDSETPEETLERHEVLHGEHRSRIDRLMSHCGIREEGESEEDIRSRRRHD